jgi:IS5 family transposase
MLRIYFLHQWYGLADEALEDTIYDSQAMRGFTGINLGVEAVPDATELLSFRHLLEAHELTARILAEVHALLCERQLLRRAGTLVDATIIAAPSSTKNKTGARNPEMHQTKKGNQWHFGRKAHIRADAESGLVHTVAGTAANVSDISQTHALLHGQEKTVHVDAGYIGVEKRAEIIAEHSGLEWRIAGKRGKIKEMPEGWVKELTLGFEKLKARARALVEHPFPYREEPLQASQSAQPRAPEEHGATAHPLCPGQPGHRREAYAQRPLSTSGEPKQPNAPPPPQ